MCWRKFGQRGLRRLDLAKLDFEPGFKHHGVEKLGLFLGAIERDFGVLECISGPP